MVPVRVSPDWSSIRFAKPKSAILRSAVGGEQDVGRFEITMHDARVVGALRHGPGAP